MAKVKRQDLEDLAKLRIDEAKALLDSKHYAGAYYFVGLAVECAIKACIAKKTEEHEFPNFERVKNSWNHKLEKLIVTTELQQELAKIRKADQVFEANWLTVIDWDVDCRYEKKTQSEAEDIFLAVTQAGHGVLEWLGKQW
jgi:HEPN domain-containing protein